jgi:MarR family transcriptional regulator, lower aerobic nicotinate degradation pathway regulator
MGNENDSQLVALVNLWAAHSSDCPDLSIEDFCVRVLAASGARPHLDLPSEGNPSLVPNHIDSYLGMFVGKLNKYSNLYFKKAFQGKALYHLEDVIYLKVLDLMGTPRKTDLIQQMVSEFPSGIDIIKRLLSAGFVQEMPDAHDKRSKRLSMTDAGQAFLEEATPLLDRVSEIAFSQLNASEKSMLLNLLGRLDHFHRVHLKEVRTLDFEATFLLLTRPVEGSV